LACPEWNSQPRRPLQTDGRVGRCATLSRPTLNASIFGQDVQCPMESRPIKKPLVYRAVIDAMVRVLREGQGQLGAELVRAGLWNQSATPTFIPEQHAINVFLQHLDSGQREVLAGMMVHQVEVGMFEALKVLEEYEVPPFEDGYEGSPIHDFVGRVRGDWDWPEEGA